MKGSKILAALLFICILFNFTSCNQPHSHKGNQNQQNQNTQEDPPKEQQITYIYSVTQEVLHLPDCYHVALMNPKYRVTYSGDITVLFAKGFTLCRDCLVSDKEDEDTTREPDPDEVPAENATYVINRSKLTIHEKNCHHVKSMAEKNVKYTCLSYEELIEKDHIPCGFCMPDEYKAYKEANPDKFKDE